MHDLFGKRMVSCRIVFFGGKSEARYALVWDLHVNPTDFDRRLTTSMDDFDCWPLSRVTIELQPAGRYRTQAPKKWSANVEDLYLWMTIDNTQK